MRHILAYIFSAIIILSIGAPAFCTEPLRLSDYQRCATDIPSEATMQQVEHEIQMMLDLRAVPPCNNVVVPVHFHVIHSGATGQLSLPEIQGQIDVLTAAYANYTFVLDTVDYTDNATWFTGISNGNATEAQVKSTLAKDLLTHLNIYTANPGGGILGWANFPWDFQGADHFDDGVVLLYSSLPGGSAYPYNEGDTATHEVGHWLGLRHIWGDGGCEVDDYVADTPNSDGANGGCPTTTSCGSLDQVENFMDYTNDACMYLFTTGQFERMCLMTELYRRGIQQDVQLCGNNQIDAGEQCDDGNLDSGDGCSSSCQIEGTGSTCMTFTAADTPVAIADTPGQMTYRSEVAVTTAANMSTIVDVNILNVQITHSWVGDMDFRLNSPKGTGIHLMDIFSCNQADVNASFDDEAAAGSLPCPPNVGATYQPAQPLATYIGENANGNWTLIVTDHGNQDGGTIDNWQVEVCTSTSDLWLFLDGFENGTTDQWDQVTPQ